MSRKLYLVEEINDEFVYTRKAIIEWMKVLDLSEVKAYITKPDRIPGVFWCRENDTFVEVDLFIGTCGKQYCDSYSPRNGKNGRCRYHDPYSHEATDDFIIIKNPSQ